MIYNETRYNSQWETKKLSQLGDFARGKSKHRPRNDKRLFENGKYPLVQTGEIKTADLYITAHTQEYGEFGLQQSKLWDAGTLCITIAANIAETAILSYPMCFPDSVVGFTAYPAESSALFMHYVFTYIRNSIQKSTSGSIQDNINIDYLTSLDFKIPAKAYQDKIVSVLGAIDKKIALNKRINAELEAMAKTIYDYWFVQFDFPDENGKPYRTSGGAMVWNEQLKRKIPKGWSVSTLSDVANITMGQSPSGDSYNEDGDGMPFFQGSTDFGIDFPMTRVYTTQPSRIAAQSDILLSVRAPVGTMNTAYEKCCIGRGLAALNSKLGASMYLHCLLKGMKPFFDVINGNGTTFGALTKDTLFNAFVVVPDDHIVNAFESSVTNFTYERLNNEKQTRELTRLRDWLLPMLMNGQATVTGSENSSDNVIRIEQKDKYDQRFNLWLQNQGLAARGDIDRQTLREIFDAMDDDDK